MPSVLALSEGAVMVTAGRGVSLCEAVAGCGGTGDDPAANALCVLMIIAAATADPSMVPGLLLATLRYGLSGLCEEIGLERGPMVRRGVATAMRGFMNDNHCYLDVTFNNRDNRL